MRYLFSANIFIRKNFLLTMLNLLLEQFELEGVKHRYKELMKSEDELKMMKLLRDYSQHFSSPFDNLKQEVSFTEDTCRLEIYTSKKELSRNKNKNQRNDIFLNSLKERCNSTNRLFLQMV